MTAGVVIQCARVDRLREGMEGSVQVPCGRCRQRVWLAKQAVQLVRGGVDPVCDVCQPAKKVGPITPGK